MKILEFNERFPDEHSCRMDMKEKREKQGLTCKGCGGNDLNFLISRYVWHCNGCRSGTTIRSGTVMQDSKLPVRVWYQCMAFMMMTGKAMSAHEMQRQLGQKNYRPVWEMMHKIRRAMGQRDDRYGLEGMIEFDEAYFSAPVKKGTQLKRGKGSQRRKSVAVMAGSIPLEDIETGNRSSQCRYFKMKVTDTQDADGINEVIKENIEDGTIVFSDKASNFVDIADLVEAHVTEYSDDLTTDTTLKWVHIAISNAKRMFLGIYHMFHASNLQNHLNEFCYKLNRRHFGGQKFDRLGMAIASSSCIQTH